jgi:hypothetical protein
MRSAWPSSLAPSPFIFRRVGVWPRVISLCRLDSLSLARSVSRHPRNVGSFRYLLSQAFDLGDDRPTPPDDPGNPSVDFHGERRSNATHQSTTDPEARLARKGPGKEARLCYAGHVQMDNRHGLVVNTRLTQASGKAEPTAALAMAAEIAGQRRVTLGADKGYDQKELVRALREYRVTPHVAQKVNSAIDRRSTRHPGYQLSQWRRKRVEEIFGWLKTVAGLRKTRHRGIARVGWTFTFAAAAYNLVRIRNLLPVAT